MKVTVGTITSSLYLTPTIFKLIFKALVPLIKETVNFDLFIFEIFFSNKLTYFPAFDSQPEFTTSITDFFSAF